ncbi:MAG: phosphoribosylanthranilate isomerase [Spirochaetaceae bacterium]|jgi:phosphoribosylanthranilate isomerase|nr:phosphoribosylanthranilate isomerase [Spirochaetaceae bacterium]
MTKIKICGLCREEDIDAANEAGPDFIGLVFAPSRRRVDFSTAAKLRSRLAEGITPVGVFADTPAADVAALFRDGVIRMAQLHGAEDAAYIASLRALCPVPVIGALRAGSAVSGAPDFARGPRGCAFLPDYFLLDAAAPGSGEAFDWKTLDDPALRREGPLLGGKPWFLAGGLGLHNIDAALALGPWGVDLSSGAETGGAKDRAKMIALVSRVHGAFC